MGKQSRLKKQRKVAKPHYGQSYSPAFLQKQYRRSMELLDWKRDSAGRFVTPSGETVSNDANAHELLMFLLKEVQKGGKNG